jgi:hypothetical protein
MHLAALDAADPELAAVYRTVSLLIARIAAGAGRLDLSAVERFAESLRPTP